MFSSIFKQPIDYNQLSKNMDVFKQLKNHDETGALGPPGLDYNQISRESNDSSLKSGGEGQHFSNPPLIISNMRLTFLK